MAEEVKDMALEEKALQDIPVPDSGNGSSVASSDTSASNEHLQGSTNPTRIIHLHHSFIHHQRRLSSPTHSPPPVQNFKRTSQVLGMVSHEISKITIFGHKHFQQKISKCHIFHKKTYQNSIYVHQRVHIKKNQIAYFEAIQGV